MQEIKEIPREQLLKFGRKGDIHRGEVKGGGGQGVQLKSLL